MLLVHSADVPHILVFFADFQARTQLAKASGCAVQAGIENYTREKQDEEMWRHAARCVLHFSGTLFLRGQFKKSWSRVGGF
jgi:hypothetical protein